MSLNTIDRNTLKDVIREIITEDTSAIKSIIKEILTEEKILLPREEYSKEERREHFVRNIFDQYDDVFKKLA